METSTKFSNTELIFVIANSIISKLFLVYPSAFSALGASASILLSVFTCVMGLLFTLLVIYFYKNKKADICDLINNKFFKTIFVVLVILLFIGNQGYFVRSVAESLKISILPESPLFFITTVYMLGVLICSHTGLKAIIRAHSIILPFTLIMVAILFASSIKNFDYYNIFPVLGNGKKMLPYLFVLTSYFADFILLMIIIPFSSERASFKKITIVSYIISSITLVAVITTYTLTIPYSASGSFFIPIYRVAQYVSYQSFLSRMESIFTIGWMLSYFMTTATYLYITSMLTGRLFKAKRYRPFMYVISVLIFAISLIPQNTNQLIEWSNFFSTPRLVVGMLIPLLILLISKSREDKQL
ncbi:MAG: GerAB/ArcD/ProY family transporter [Clostridia bacterium]|nr:GerAB/ArcD/ProY family transporter [Clostridia bacterium]